MMADTPTFAFEDDKTYAILDGQVLASGTDPDAVADEAERKLKEKAEREAEEKESARVASATHIVSPGGLKGKIVNRTASWDAAENVSVRFDNGRIVTVPTHKLSPEQFVTEGIDKTASADSPITRLATKLDDDYGKDKDALRARLTDLQNIKAEASQHIANGVSYFDEQKLDQLVILADSEASEVAEALEYLETADAELNMFEPPKPQVVEQAQVGTQDGGNWLDHTVNEMVGENQNQDFEKLLHEGPVEVMAELPDAAVEDVAVATAAARDFISSKTAGLEGEEVEKYRAVFLERAEDARRKETTERKQIATREASVVESSSQDDRPDEALFS